MRLRRADHVEVVVGREVGSELVRYVFDFGKYYAALTDTFVYRAGDVVGGAGRGAAGDGLGRPRCLAAPLAIGWTTLGVRLSYAQRARHRITTGSS